MDKDNKKEYLNQLTAIKKESEKRIENLKKDRLLLNKTRIKMLKSRGMSASSKTEVIQAMVSATGLASFSRTLRGEANNIQALTDQSSYNSRAFDLYLKQLPNFENLIQKNDSYETLSNYYTECRNKPLNQRDLNGITLRIIDDKEYNKKIDYLVHAWVATTKKLGARPIDNPRYKEDKKLELQNKTARFDQEYKNQIEYFKPPVYELPPTYEQVKTLKEQANPTVADMKSFADVKKHGINVSQSSSEQTVARASHSRSQDLQTHSR